MPVKSTRSVRFEDKRDKGKNDELPLVFPYRQFSYRDKPSLHGKWRQTLRTVRDEDKNFDPENLGMTVDGVEYDTARWVKEEKGDDEDE